MNKFLLQLLVFCVFSVHAKPDWELIKNHKGIKIYSIQQPNHKLKHHKGETEIEHDADTVLAALQDTSACSQWVHNCVSNRMVEMIDVKQRIFHTVIHSPLWFKDRDFYLKSYVTYDPKKQLFSIDFISKPNHAKVNEDRVRVTDVSMTWLLKRVTDKKTAVTYQVYIDPKLPIKSINHSMIKKSIYNTMQGLTELVENPQYAETKYSASELEMLVPEEPDLIE